MVIWGDSIIRQCDKIKRDIPLKIQYDLFSLNVVEHPKKGGGKKQTGVFISH